jgi:tetratricopeptide (TPR) repeat protein/tRNA A-37 threonylcarbamoyl transferase component Bud32
MVKKGDTVGHFEIVHLLGEGGMGQVYLARDTKLDRNVAIKFLPPDMERDPQMRTRFIREAKSAAALDHPFICKVYETGESEERTFIAMEYVQGKELKERTEEEPFSISEVFRITLEIAEALDEAHRKGIVHRDLKPANIMITPQGHVKVMDFGLAKRVLPKGEENIAATITQSSITEQGVIAGTIAYMSPEQARGDEVDARSDIFSLGIIFQEMLSGIHPFSKPSAIETLSSILRDPPPITQVKPKSINPSLAPVLKKALAKEQEDRYQSVDEFIQDLKKLQKEVTGEGRIRLSKWQMAVGAILIVAMILTGVWIFTRGPSQGQLGTGPAPISVLIADFQNMTDEPIFDGVLEKTMSIYIEGASFISIRNRHDALRSASKLDPRTRDILDEELAQLVSRSEGVNVVVAGLIEESRKGYNIRVWARDPVSAEKISDYSENFETKDGVLKAAEKVALKLRSDLGDVPAESIQALTKETFTTTSIEAMKAYAHAQELADEEKPEEALQEYLKALDYDPNFGRAYASIAVVYFNLGQYKEAEKYFQEAFKRIDQMTDREKFRTQGSYYLMKRDFKNAITQYSSLLEQYPGDFTAHAMLAFAYFYARNMTKAVEEGQQDVKYSPQSLKGRFNLSWYALAAGDFQTAEDEAQGILEQDPDVLDVYVVLALAQLAQGRPAEAAETYQKLEGLDSRGAALATTGLADLAVYEGQLKEAIKLLERGIDFDQANKENYIAAEKSIMLAKALLIQEKNSLAVAAVERALEIDVSNDILFSAAQVCLATGDVEKARALAAELNKKVESEPRAYAKLIGGEMSLVRGDVSTAIGLFMEAQELLDTWLGHFFLGKAYLEAEEFPQAYSEFEQCLKRRGEATSVFLNDLPSFHYFPPLHYYLGRAQEGLGSEAANESYAEFLRIKEKDDGSDPMVQDARRRAENLSD